MSNTTWFETLGLAAVGLTLAFIWVFIVFGVAVILFTGIVYLLGLLLNWLGLCAALTLVFSLKVGLTLCALKWLANMVFA